MLSNKIVKACASCGVKLDEKSKFAICEDCFQNRRFRGKNRGGTYTRSGNAERQRQNRKKLSTKLRGKSNKSSDKNRRGGVVKKSSGGNSSSKNRR